MSLNAQFLNLLLRELNKVSIIINISYIWETMRSNLHYCCFYKQSFRICVESFRMLCAGCLIAHFNSSYHSCCNHWIRLGFFISWEPHTAFFKSSTHITVFDAVQSPSLSSPPVSLGKSWSLTISLKKNYIEEFLWIRNYFKKKIS